MAILNALPGAIAQGLIWGIMAIGLYITYKILDFADLTVDGSICTGAAVCVILITNGVNAWVALLVAFIAGLGCGLVTAMFNTVMGIPPILAGILTQLILWTVNLKILGRANVSASARKYDLIVSSMDITKAILILLAFAVVIILLLYLFFGTEIGRAIRATGNNPKMAKAQGINTKLCKIIGLMLSNGLVSLSGGLLSQYQGFADVTMGRGAIVVGLAAVIIGGALFSRISRNFIVKLLSVLIGGVIYYIVYQVVIGLGLDTDMLKMLSAVIVAVFLAVPYWRKKLKPYLKRRRKKTDGAGSDGDNSESSTVENEIETSSDVNDEPDALTQDVDAFDAKANSEAATEVDNA